MRLPLGTLLATLLVLGLTVSLVPAAAAGTGDETIGVSGHWVIEVHQPDGTPVSRREFHNALASPATIPIVLGGKFTAGPLQISLNCVGTGCVPPCPGSCRIVEPRLAGFATASMFKNLTVSLLPGGFQGFQVQGRAMVSSDSTIAQVDTMVNLCPPATNTAICGMAGTPPLIASLTTASLSPAIAVVAGQQVVVTVTITFATATAPPASVVAPR
jgi:hypothetical protein